VVGQSDGKASKVTTFSMAPISNPQTQAQFLMR